MSVILKRSIPHLTKGQSLMKMEVMMHATTHCVYTDCESIREKTAPSLYLEGPISLLDMGRPFVSHFTGQGITLPHPREVAFFVIQCFVFIYIWFVFCFPLQVWFSMIRYAVLEITVGHRTLSNQILKMSGQFHIMIGHDDRTCHQHILSLLQGVVSQ